MKFKSHAAQCNRTGVGKMNTKPVTVVMVHGAWADESSWDKVTRLLQSRGINAVTTSIPLSSLADDVDALDGALARVDGPAILVGHAYAGAVIASTHSEKVKALVYVAGLAPDEGETVADVFYRYEHDDRAPPLAPEGGGWIWWRRKGFDSAFAQPATAQEWKALAPSQRPISPACITV